MAFLQYLVQDHYKVPPVLGLSAVGLGEGLDVDAVDVEAGAAEDVEAYDELGAGAGVDDLAFESHEAAAKHLYAVASAERGGFDGHGGVGVAEDEAECAHLAVGNSGGCALSGDRLVGHEAVDVGQGDYEPTLLFGAVNEDDCAYYDCVDCGATTVSPDFGDLLRRDIGVVAERGEASVYIFLAIVVDNSHVPFGGRHACGVASDVECCRKVVGNLCSAHCVE